LKAEGCERIYSEQVSSVDATRPQLEAALDFAREGDVLIVTKLDRLARSMSDLMAIEAALTKKGVALLILSPKMETETPAGRLIFTVLGGIAQFEREIMLERQREGIARAKGEGRYKGRAATVMAVSGQIWAFKRAGMGATAIARELGVHRDSVYRILKEPEPGA
jgi:DNA invertase Pin-like site-specific DNA recombinase